MNKPWLLAALALWCIGCGPQASTMPMTYLGEGQGIVSQIEGLYFQEQAFTLQQAQQQAELKRLQQQQP